MNPNSPSPRPISAAVSKAAATDGSYLDWPAIVAGGVFALAMSFILIGFGASIGLSIVSPYRGEGVSAAWLAIAAGLWFIWVAVSSFGAGGYLCGRMRRRAGDATADEVEVRDGAHGLTVWAVGALVGSVLAASGVTGLVGAGASAVGSAVGTTADAAAEAVSSDYFASVLLRSGVEAPAAGAAGGGGAAASGDQDAGTAQSGNARGEAATGATAPTGAAGTMSASGSAGTTAAQGGMDADPAVQPEIAALLLGAVAAFFAATAGGRHRDDGLASRFSPRAAEAPRSVPPDPKGHRNARNPRLAPRSAAAGRGHHRRAALIRQGHRPKPHPLWKEDTMPMETRNQMFIETLTEIWRDDRAAKEDQRRHQLKVAARRFVDGFRKVPAAYPDGPGPAIVGAVRPGIRSRPDGAVRSAPIPTPHMPGLTR